MKASLPLPSLSDTHDSHNALSEWLGWLEHRSDLPRLQVDTRSQHMQESTSECINKWNNKSMFLSLSPSLSVSKITSKKKKTPYTEPQPSPLQIPQTLMVLNYFPGPQVFPQTFTPGSAFWSLTCPLRNTCSYTAAFSPVL